jgi:molybdopterin/thiamine biosynthesis adenylyltransferase/rhodanese-related sulfurtransferase
MPSFRELLAATKSEIREVDTATADEQRRRPGAVVLDVREPDEYQQGAIPGAVHIPRGTLEGSVESRLPDRSAPVIIHCASGVRSAFAAKTLAELGYTDVVSMTGGFNKWKDEGRDWSTPRSLTPEQRNRYQRHVLLPEVDIEGQLKLLDARVLLLGAGGLHNVDRIGERKVDSAKKTLTALNPDVDVVTHDVRLGADNVMSILSGYDLVVDGADNFPVRYLLNDAALKLGIPVVHGSIFRFEGQVTVFKPHDGPCYRCFLPEPPPPELAPSCAEAGVLGVLPGIVGSIQAVEAIKLILGLGDDLSGRLLAYDSLEQSFRTYKMLRDPQCPTCSIDPEQIVIAEYDELCMPHPMAPPAG